MFVISDGVLEGLPGVDDVFKSLMKNFEIINIILGNILSQTIVKLAFLFFSMVSTVDNKFRPGSSIRFNIWLNNVSTV